MIVLGLSGAQVDIVHGVAFVVTGMDTLTGTSATLYLVPLFTITYLVNLNDEFSQ